MCNHQLQNGKCTDNHHACLCKEKNNYTIEITIDSIQVNENTHLVTHFGKSTIVSKKICSKLLLLIKIILQCDI